MRSHLVCSSSFSFPRRIRKRRCGNQVARVRAFIARDETFTDSGVHRAVCGTRLVRESGEVGLGELLFKVLAWVPGHDVIAQLRRKLVESHSDHIESDTRMK